MPGQPDMGSTYKKETQVKVLDERFLPRDFYPALMEAEKSTFLPKVLGTDLFNNYLGLKISEWDEYRTTITDFEHQRYMNI